MGRPSKYEQHRDLVLRLIQEANLSHGKSPSVRDLAQSAGVGVATMHSYLEKLSEEGLILWRPRAHRAIQCTPLGHQRLMSQGQSPASGSSPQGDPSPKDDPVPA